MSSDLTADEITRRCQDLVFQVAYAFYDSPYIILLRVLAFENVIPERKFAELLGINPMDIRKYLGMLHVHRLVRRHVNKERLPLSAFQQRQIRENGATYSNVSVDPNNKKEFTKMRDVIYWYLDYREFADVVKYRLAMMRKDIDEKIKQETGHRGYICPNCGSSYNPLDLSSLFNPSTNAFHCELCNTELIEDDPSLHQPTDSSASGSTVGDRMQRFNLATAGIRDALKSIEGVESLPSTNIMAWIAQNVKADSAGAEGGEDGKGVDGKRRVDVVIGEGDDEEAKKKLAEQQRAQNALPIWYTHSTITGDATTLGLKDAAQSAAAAAAFKNSERASRRGVEGGEGDEDDDAIARHFANLDDDDEGERGVVGELGGEEDDGLELEETGGDETNSRVLTVMVQDASVQAGKETSIVLTVNGQPKALADITEDDEALMTPEEYEKYYEAAASAL